MEHKIKPPVWRKLAILLAVALLIKIFAVFNGAVENLYATGVYPVIAVILRAIAGWLPFSLGDILYGAIIIWLLVRLIKLFTIAVTGKATWQGFGRGAIKIIIRLLYIYIIFNILWGMNYDRRGISYQLKLDAGRYSTDELKALTGELIERVDSARLALGDRVIYPAYQDVFKQAAAAYTGLRLQYPFLRYAVTSIKKSLYGRVDNDFGFLGYYNPFTGEAQVNTGVPAFLIPYTTCHEIAHQLGYGSESEANFVGYLSAKASGNPFFRYSVYFDLFNYANGELFLRDSAAARANYHMLDTLVKRDYHIYRDFWLAHKNPAEPLIRLFYGEYLKANNQPKGIETYDDVVAWLIAYRKKNGRI
ncbi:MAG TPA: DUF3810 domain-containing protein [Chitinophagaceae bacterium]|nr:DUF3810 domain-containing protein [Chitinophagaceae bacterium]